MRSTLQRLSASAMIRPACVLAGMLGLFLQGSNGGHMLVVEHSRCAEHGELVHGGDAHPHVAAAHTHGDSAAVHGTPDDGSNEAHEHCALSVDRRDAPLSIVARVVSTRSVPAAPDLAVVDAVVVARTVLLRLAPKTSPPA